jgi:hypothetical protein
MKAGLWAGFVVIGLAITVSAQPAGRGGAGAGGQQGGRGGPAGPPNLGQPPSDTPGKIEIVAVTGCLRQQGADWMLVAATDPLVSVANAPQRSEIPTTPPAGKNQFRLIGVGEFDLPSHKDKTVLVKALYIKATPVSRLNLTSLVDAVSTCAADAPK